MLGAIAGFFHWVEELLNILNGPLLMFGGGVALVDLLTDGALTTSAQWLLYAWAISQALGVDTQLLGCFARGRAAVERGKLGPVFGWIILGLILALFAGQSMYVFAIQQSEHLSEGLALGMLRIDPLWWYGERAALAVGLIALSGWTRYRAPSVAMDPSVRVAQLEGEARIAAAEAELRRQRAVGWKALIQDIGKREPEPEPDPGDFEEVADPNATLIDLPAISPAAPVYERNTVAVPVVRSTSVRSASRRKNKSPVMDLVARREERVAEVVDLLRATPGLTVRVIAKRIGVSQSTANSYIHLAQERMNRMRREGEAISS